MPHPTHPPMIVPPAGGTAMTSFGENFLFKLTGEQTNRAFTLWLEVTEPGHGPPPHYHDAEDELFLVQHGRVQFLVDGEWVEPGEGSVVYVPRQNVHAFRNAGDAPSRMWILTTPSGFETFIARTAEEFKGSTPPDMPKVLKMSADFGIHFV